MAGEGHAYRLSLTQVVKDTYIDAICSQHRLPSPCDCGEPLNTVARDLFTEPHEFDPLQLNHRGKMKGLALLVGSIILSLALSESVSKYGVLENFTLHREISQPRKRKEMLR